MTAVDSPLVHEVRALFTLDPETVQNPYPLYERLRAEAPVLQYDETTVIVSSYAEARVIYLDHARFPVATERGVRFAGKLALLSDEERRLHQESLDFEKLFSTNRNGADHRRVRGAAQRAFTPRRVAQLRTMIDETCDELLREYDGNEPADFSEFASRLPLYVIMNMLGVPREEAERLKQWSDELNLPRTVLRPEAVRTAHQALTNFRAYVADLVDHHRRTGRGDGLVADLLGAEQDNRVSDEEVVATFVHFLFAGHETTSDLLGNLLHAMLRHPDQWARVKADPSLVDGAVEEVLRWDPSVQFFQRVAAPGAVIAGAEIPEGSFVIMLNAAANRDAATFRDPDVYDVSRRPNEHLTFGHGIHFCIGAPVARLEAQIALTAIARHYPEVRCAVDLDELRIVPNISLRGYGHFPVVLGRRSERA